MDIGVQWPIAKNSNGEYVIITNAISGGYYFCPECNNRMVAKKGKERRHHFSHYFNVGDSCLGESAYHVIAKHLLVNYFSQRKKINYYNVCPFCKKQNSFSKEILNITTEKFTEKYRPDLLIQLSDDIIYGEIIYKHGLKEKFHDYRCHQSNLIVWFIDGYRQEVPEIKIEPWESAVSENKLSRNYIHLLSNSLITYNFCEPCRKSLDRYKKRKARERETERQREERKKRRIKQQKQLIRQLIQIYEKQKRREKEREEIKEKRKAKKERRERKKKERKERRKEKRFRQWLKQTKLSELQPGIPIEFCRECCCAHHGGIKGSKEWCGFAFSNKPCPWRKREDRIAEWQRIVKNK